MRLTTNVISKSELVSYAIDGFLSVFTFNSNPLKKLWDEIENMNDEEQIASDWKQVGDDIRAAYGQFEKETGKGNAAVR